MKVDLPTPGVPESPIRKRLTPTCSQGFQQSIACPR